MPRCSSTVIHAQGDEWEKSYEFECRQTKGKERKQKNNNNQVNKTKSAVSIKHGNKKLREKGETRSHFQRYSHRSCLDLAEERLRDVFVFLLAGVQIIGTVSHHKGTTSRSNTTHCAFVCWRGLTYISQKYHVPRLNLAGNINGLYILNI